MSKSTGHTGGASDGGGGGAYGEVIKTWRYRGMAEIVSCSDLYRGNYVGAVLYLKK